MGQLQGPGAGREADGRGAAGDRRAAGQAEEAGAAGRRGGGGGGQVDAAYRERARLHGPLLPAHTAGSGQEFARARNDREVLHPQEDRAHVRGPHQGHTEDAVVSRVRAYFSYLFDGLQGQSKCCVRTVLFWGLYGG